mmetsp:Transcript_48701/g.74091  ORF Transcript_48701/g.74091 Transcript_48701/m.74091 type:complete len:214 (-) Transcript_48701:266-907(-)
MAANSTRWRQVPHAGPSDCLPHGLIRLGYFVSRGSSLSWTLADGTLVFGTKRHQVHDVRILQRSRAGHQRQGRLVPKRRLRGFGGLCGSHRRRPNVSLGDAQGSSTNKPEQVSPQDGPRTANHGGATTRARLSIWILATIMVATSCRDHGELPHIRARCQGDLQTHSTKTKGRMRHFDAAPCHHDRRLHFRVCVDHRVSPGGFHNFLQGSVST